MTEFPGGTSGAPWWPSGGRRGSQSVFPAVPRGRRPGRPAGSWGAKVRSLGLARLAPPPACTSPWPGARSEEGGPGEAALCIQVLRSLSSLPHFVQNFPKFLELRIDRKVQRNPLIWGDN